MCPILSLHGISSRFQLSFPFSSAYSYTLLTLLIAHWDSGHVTNRWVCNTWVHRGWIACIRIRIAVINFELSVKLMVASLVRLPFKVRQNEFGNASFHLKPLDGQIANWPINLPSTIGMTFFDLVTGFSGQVLHLDSFSVSEYNGGTNFSAIQTFEIFCFCRIWLLWPLVGLQHGKDKKTGGKLFQKNKIWKYKNQIEYRLPMDPHAW